MKLGECRVEKGDPMTEQENQDPMVIAEHATGSVSDPEELNLKISEAWASLISKPMKKAEIAKALGVSEEKLRSENPPFNAYPGPAGIIETTILILLAKGFVGGVGAAAGKATFEYLRSLWNEVAEPLEDPRTQTIGAAVNRPATNTGAGATAPLPGQENGKPGS
jgi:hypothetical protein